MVAQRMDYRPYAQRSFVALAPAQAQSKSFGMLPQDKPQDGKGGCPAVSEDRGHNHSSLITQHCDLGALLLPVPGILG
jgi:hypothetical protein